jgi:hypothetical protein
MISLATAALTFAVLKTSLAASSGSCSVSGIIIHDIFVLYIALIINLTFPSLIDRSLYL